MSISWLSSEEFFGSLRWIDGRPLFDMIEPYRRRLFAAALDSAEAGLLTYNLVLAGRAKKNFKSADLVLAGLFALVANDSPGGNQVYLFGNDEDQAGRRPEPGEEVRGCESHSRRASSDSPEGRSPGRTTEAFMQILPAQDIAGSHGKTYRFCGFDEIHGHRTWDLLEAMQLDPDAPGRTDVDHELRQPLPPAGRAALRPLPARPCRRRSQDAV